MHTGAGIVVIVVAVALLVLTSIVLRPRIPRPATDLLAASSGAAVAIGGLLLLHDDVSMASWIAAPVVLGLLAVAHTRMLFGGGGPFRT
ncbi:MAG: hypothetical protein ABI828_04805 [Actinomycetota bacterium]